MSLRRIEQRWAMVAMVAVAACNGGTKAGDGDASAAAGDPGTTAGNTETAACVDAQRTWVLAHVPTEQQQDVEGTIRALLHDRDALNTMPVCSGP